MKNKVLVAEAPTVQSFLDSNLEALVTLEESIDRLDDIIHELSGDCVGDTAEARPKEVASVTHLWQSISVFLHNFKDRINDVCDSLQSRLY